MKYCFIILAAAFFSWFMLPKPCLGQSGKVDNIYPNRAVHVGLGRSSAKTITYTINVEWISRFGLIMGRITRVNKDEFYSRNKPAERNADFALMYGWKHFFRPDENNGVLSVSLTTGIAFTRFIRQTNELASEGECFLCRSTYKTNNEHMRGIPIELRFALIEQYDRKGMSVGLWYNVNRRKNFGGVVVSLYILRG